MAIYHQRRWNRYLLLMLRLRFLNPLSQCWESKSLTEIFICCMGQWFLSCLGSRRSLTDIFSRDPVSETLDAWHYEWFWVVRPLIFYPRDPLQTYQNRRQTSHITTLMDVWWDSDYRRYWWNSSQRLCLELSCIFCLQKKNLQWKYLSTNFLIQPFFMPGGSSN